MQCVISNPYPFKELMKNISNVLYDVTIKFVHGFGVKINCLECTQQVMVQGSFPCIVNIPGDTKSMSFSLPLRPFNEVLKKISNSSVFHISSSDLSCITLRFKDSSGTHRFEITTREVEEREFEINIPKDGIYFVDMGLGVLKSLLKMAKSLKSPSVLIRLMQGLSVGGQLVGAILSAVEAAPAGRASASEREHVGARGDDVAVQLLEELLARHVPG